MRTILLGCVLLLACHPDKTIGAPDLALSAPDLASTVDLQGFAVAPHRPMPAVPTLGAGLLTPMRLVTIVAQNEDPTSAQQLFAFSDAAINSQWFTSWAGDYGVAAPRASRHLTGAAITTNPSNAVMMQYIRDTYNAASNPPVPDGKTLYLLYLPQGIAYLVNGAPNTNCPGGAEGFHGGIGTLGDGWSPIMRCPTPAGRVELDELTRTASHEIAEAATDTAGKGWRLSLGGAQPWTATPWIECEGGVSCEIGDLCTLNKKIVENGSMYQRIFSNAAAASGGDPCVPALPLPYYDLSSDQDWHAGAAGATVSIPVTGWSTAPLSGWTIRAAIGASSDASLVFTVSLTDATPVTLGAKSYKTIANGQTVHLLVSIPAGAPSGAWATVVMESEWLDAQGQRLDGDDYAHRQIFGAYVN